MNFFRYSCTWQSGTRTCLCSTNASHSLTDGLFKVINFGSVSITPKTPSRHNRADLLFLSPQPLQALHTNVYGRLPQPGTYTECLGNTILLVFGVKPRRWVQVWNQLGDMPGVVATVGSV